MAPRKLLKLVTSDTDLNRVQDRSIEVVNPLVELAAPLRCGRYIQRDQPVTPGLMTFDGLDYNTGLAVTPSPLILRAGRSGVFHLAGTLNVTASVTGTLLVDLYQNGAAVMRLWQHNSVPVTTFTANFACDVQLGASDTVTLAISGTATATLNGVTASGLRLSHVQVHYAGQ